MVLSAVEWEVSLKLRSSHFVHSSFSLNIKKLREAFCRFEKSSNDHTLLFNYFVSGSISEMEVSLEKGNGSVRNTAYRHDALL